MYSALNVLNQARTLVTCQICNLGVMRSYRQVLPTLVTADWASQHNVLAEKYIIRVIHHYTNAYIIQNFIPSKVVRKQRARG